MPNEAVEQAAGRSAWQAYHVYAMAAVCLIVGLAAGYLFRGSQSPAAQANEATKSAIPSGAMGGQTPTLEQMKHMADVQVRPLLDKLKNNGADADLLAQVGNVYRSAHQFKDAADYYGKSLQINPRNVVIRTEMASCLYYTGDVDGALSQLQQSLKDDPRDANALFNLGLIRWDAKKDGPGAISAWRELLKSNPKLDARKKAQVEKLIAKASKSTS
ncbi:MAG TPA: tetratricopeptide repeat protein [Terriglobales bacterium]|nr:tetratricopeptide repeat protein [Terriglobales bacterium]